MSKYWITLLTSTLLLSWAPLRGQLDQSVKTTVTTPEGVDYQVSFRTVYQMKGAKVLSGGTIELEQPTNSIFRIKNFKVTGRDQAVADNVNANLNLPPAFGGGSMMLSNGNNTQKSKKFMVRHGRLAAGTEMVIALNGTTMKRLHLDLNRTFRLAGEKEKPAPVPEVTKPEPETVSPPKPGPVVVVTTPEKKPKWETDFAEMSARAFVDKWGTKKRNLAQKALRKIGLQPSVREVEENVYVLEFNYVSDLRLDTVTGGDDYVVELDRKVPPYGHELRVRVTGAGNYRIYLSDAGKVKGTAVVELDNLLEGLLKESTDTVSFTLSGGMPPYRLVLLDGNEPVGETVIRSGNEWTIAKSDLRNSVTKGQAGSFGVELTDEQRVVVWDFDGQSITVPETEKKPFDPRPYLYGAGGLALFIAFLLVRNSQRKKRASRIRENVADEESATKKAATSHRKRLETAHEPRVLSGSALVAETTSKPREPITAASNGAVTEPKQVRREGGFRVTRRAKADNSTRAFHPDDRPKDFLPLHLDRNWASSRVETILFSKPAIFKLDDFLRRENTSKIANSGARAKAGGWERNEAIPEIGGMLMGQYRLGADGGKYRVSVEEFIPLEARVQNVVKVEIDPLSLARDLSRAQDEHPDLTVVGWFHTHPGHGLFLSQPDLKVQYGQFREPYNFAMEIDSLTENLDTAFFTYLPDGTMNNRHTRQPESSWFSWSEIEKFTRR